MEPARLGAGYAGLVQESGAVEWLSAVLDLLLDCVRLQIISKETWKRVIHRSPDRLDAVIMAIAGRGFVSFGSADELTGPVAF